MRNAPKVDTLYVVTADDAWATKGSLVLLTEIINPAHMYGMVLFGELTTYSVSYGPQHALFHINELQEYTPDAV
jgi:hypothetical protein